MISTSEATDSGNNEKMGKNIERLEVILNTGKVITVDSLIIDNMYPVLKNSSQIKKYLRRNQPLVINDSFIEYGSSYKSTQVIPRKSVSYMNLIYDKEEYPRGPKGVNFDGS